MIKTPLSTVIGGAFWTPGATILGSSSKNLTQLIKSLFSLGEQGFAYDPNDLTTLYRDAAGTIPVTAAGQPVGLMKDKSGRNNHAFQTVSASRPILQQTRILGNELVVNGDFSDGVTGWGAVDGTTEVILNGYLKFNNAVAANPNVIQNNVIRPAKTYAVSFNVANRTAGGVFLALYGESGTSNVLTTIVQANGVFSTIISSPVDATGTIGIRTQTNTTLDITNISIREITGYRTDQNYLKFDGVDDFLQTNNIDFTATDKVSLFAGVRKLSDATTAVIAELSASIDANQGTFRLTAPAGGGTTKFQYVSRGSSSLSFAQVSTTNFNAPISVVSSCKSDISNDICALRLNGQVVATSSTDQGVGNYGNYPLYIGRRGDTSLPFNGHIYSLIGISRLTTDAETLALEKAIAKATGV